MPMRQQAPEPSAKSERSDEFMLKPMMNTTALIPTAIHSIERKYPMH